MIGTLNKIKDQFFNYKTIALNGKIATLEISKDLNYISRCSRDIMLGNEYDMNLNKIIVRIKSIENYFNSLEKSISYMKNPKESQKLLYKTKESTLHFIYDVLNKMQLIQMNKTPSEVYQVYKKESTPLAIKSREFFEKLKDNQNISFEYFTNKFERDIKNQRDIVLSSALLFGFFIIIFGLSLYKYIIRQIKTQEELTSTKNLLVQYKNAIDETNIVSKTDLAGNITYVNNEFCKISQYEKNELINHSHNIIRHSNTSKEKFKELWQTIKNKKSWHGLIENRKKDGSSYFVYTSIFPIMDSEGKTNEFIAIRKDITEFIELNNKLSSSQEEILTRIGMIAETRSKETSNHVRRVAEYSKILAVELNMNSKEIELLYNATALHDIGKVATPDYILNKPEKLTVEEFEVMKRHSSDGYAMLKDTGNEIIKAGAIIAHEHHEKWDGTGYPRGIKGEEIHIFARITAIADVFDALGSKRTYKDAWDLNEIVEFINSQSGKHFDPRLVEIFNERFDDFVFIRKKFRSEY